MGTGGETLATEISNAPTCESLQASRYNNKRTMTKDIFSGMFRGPGASTKNIYSPNKMLIIAYPK